MDDGSGRAQRDSRAGGQGPGARRSSASHSDGRGQANAASPARAERTESAPRGGGLLSRYGQSGSAGGVPQSAGRDGQQNRLRGALDALTGQARRLGDNIRKVTEGPRNPRAGEWKATDFDPHTLRAWDEREEVPFEVPPDPYDSAEREVPSRRGSSSRDRDPRGGVSSGGRGGQGGGAHGGGRRGPRDWDDQEWDAGWETGTWDTGWATDFRPSVEYARSGARDEYDDSGFWAPGRGGGPARRGYDTDEDALSQSLSTLAELGAVGRPMGRVERVRLLMRRRPAAAAMLAFFVLGFMLACCAPLIPVMRLGYDALDASRRVSNIQAIFAGGTSALFNGSKLQEAKAEVDGITHDLYEINSAMNVAGAPLAAVSPAIRSYRLLTRIGFDLTAAADEGLDVAQTLLVPLEGGALSANSSTPGITTADIQQAQSILVDASARISDAISAYSGIDVGALPGILQPTGKYGKYFSLLPTAQSVLNELSTLLPGVTSLLGVGSPAYYLVVLMDRSELRPGGGFQGNYGILTIEGGKQSAQHPLQFNSAYDVDTAYFNSLHPEGQNDCSAHLDQPPQYYWWWPYRINAGTPPPCTFNWGMRDANLSPDFPQNALTDMQIVQDAGEVSKADPHAQLQGEIAFTPVLAKDLMAPDVLGPIAVPGFGVVPAQDVEHDIHESKLGAGSPKSGDKEAFTQAFGKALLDKLKSAKGDTLKKVLGVVEKDLKNKELELYLRDPNAELVLRQLGLASAVNQSGSDGFFVVDTNFGGNKANTYVTEDQTDAVTLLPSGGALHHLRIAVTYNMTGPVYDGTENQRNYIDLQRTYLPGDATILGYSGFAPSIYSPDPSACPSGFELPISDCSKLHAITKPTTLSDVSGRTMVMGGVFVLCGEGTSGIETSADFGAVSYGENKACLARVVENLPPIVHTQVIYVDFYTPHAFTMDANGHGTYSEVVEKQSGSVDYLTVYVNTSQLHAASPSTGTLNDGTLTITNEDQFNALIANLKPTYKRQQIMSDTTISKGF